MTAFPTRIKERIPSLHLANRERNKKRRNQQNKRMESENVKQNSESVKEEKSESVKEKKSESGVTAFPRRAKQLLNAPEHSPVGRVRQLCVCPGMSGLQNITIEVSFKIDTHLGIWA